MLLRQTLLYLPAQVLGPLFQFIAIVAWTHFLTPVDMGVFALVVALQELAYTATTFWFTLYILRYHDRASSTDERQRLLNTETLVLGVASAATVAFVLLLPLVTSVELTVDLAWATIAYCVTRGLVTHLSDRARAEHDTLTYSVLQISWPVLGFACALALLLGASQTSASIVLWGYAIAQSFSLLVAGRRMEFGIFPQNYAPEAIHLALKYGLPLLIGGILVWVANNGVRFIVEMRDGAVAVGLVTVGWGLGLRVASFAALLVTAAAFPVALRRARSEGMAAGQAQLERNGILLLAILAPAAAGLVAIGEPFVRLVVAQEFQQTTIEVLPYAVLAGVLRNFRIHFGEQVFLLHERPMVPLWNDAIDAALAIMGCLSGLWISGLSGAVIGAAVGSALSLMITLGVGWSAYRFRPDLGASLRVIIASLGMMAAVSVLPSIGPPVVALSLAISLGVAVYAAALVLLLPDALSRIVALLKGEQKES